MTTPAYEQVKVGTPGVGSLTSSLTMNATSGAGNSLYVAIMSKVSTSTASSPFNYVRANPAGDDPVAMTLVHSDTLKYESHKRLSLYKVDGLLADDYVVEIACNGLAAECAISAIAFELSDASSIEAFVANTHYTQIDSENGATSVTFPTLPSTGNFNSSEVFLIAVTGTGEGTASDLDWAPPTNWTQIGELPDSSSNKNALAVSYYVPESANAVSSIQYASTNADTYGRVGIMLALVPTGPSLTKKVRIVHQDDSLTSSITGVKVQVFANPTGSNWTGSPLFTVSDLAWEIEEVDSEDRSVLKITVPATNTWLTSGITLSVDDTVVCGGGIPGTEGALMGDSGFKGFVVGTVIEE